MTELEQKDLFGNVIRPEGSVLVNKFVVPPFSILDAQQGYWGERKEVWRRLGLKGDEGRDETVLWSPSLEKYRPGLPRISVFDPVLCEVVYSWFCPPAGTVLDPFAGAVSRGVVAEVTGHPYTGIELRQEQVDANYDTALAMGVTPEWITGSSERLDEILPAGQLWDLVFTCPPYFDLEVYSSKDGDGSAFASYEAFTGWYVGIFKQAVRRLRANRFLVVVVGEIRDERGVYRNFVGDNVGLFTGLHLAYYNEIIFRTMLGTAPVRANTTFPPGRKIVKVHQSLVFYKGDPETIKIEFGEFAS